VSRSKFVCFSQQLDPDMEQLYDIIVRQTGKLAQEKVAIESEPKKPKREPVTDEALALLNPKGN